MENVSRRKPKHGQDKINLRTKANEELSYAGINETNLTKVVAV